MLKPFCVSLRMVLENWQHLFWGSLFLFAETFKLHQVGWGACIHSHFQISLKMFSCIQVWALTEPFKVVIPSLRLSLEQVIIKDNNNNAVIMQ